MLSMSISIPQNRLARSKINIAGMRSFRGSRLRTIFLATGFTDSQSAPGVSEFPPMPGPP